MPQVDIIVDKSSLDRVVRELSGFPGEAKKVLAAGLNDARKRGKGKFVDAAAKEITAQKRFIRKRVVEGERATPSNLSATIRIKGARLALLRFKVKGGKRKRLLTAEIFRGRRESFPDAFIGIGPKNSVHVLSRKGGKRRISQAHHKPNLNKIRQDVATRGGISLPQVFQVKPAAFEKAKKEVADILQTRTLSQLDRVLQRRKANA